MPRINTPFEACLVGGAGWGEGVGSLGVLAAEPALAVRGLQGLIKSHFLTEQARPAQLSATLQN